MPLTTTITRALLLLGAHAAAQDTTMGKKVFAHYMVECIPFLGSLNHG